MKSDDWLLRLIGWSSLLVAILFISTGSAITMGAAKVGFWEVWQVLGYHILGSLVPEPDPAAMAIVWQIRLPRVILAVLVGASLAGAGVVFQGLLRNPLADPYVLGVSSGAALGAAVAIFTGWGSFLLKGWTVPAWAFVTACVALFAVLRLARIGPMVRVESLILSGVVVQAFFGAILTYMIATVSAQEMQRIQFWLMGSLALREWEQTLAIFPFLFAGLAVIWLFSRSLNLFALGEESAGHLGVAVHRTRLLLLLTATLMTAAAVSVSGTIGFVGLVIPHVMRMLCGSDHRVLIPVSALAGSVFLVWADTLARTVLDPRELPIGVITAFVGAPFFAWLLKRKRGRVFHS
ncbi:iron ABC transporter permease [Kroppenstedtia pulmonis]|uniref:Iron ABC transporter permease n=1 Tax=Kroppenstedtia pulmonis TaxID=1380685 RepID=A0A7D3XL69_9BACL|nr:iron ABC transporter permease [Kroppenstedtia pulmonis]QKG83509.1 iron ABC transporter permease [Kroppenstedtia pulmonis]